MSKCPLCGGKLEERAIKHPHEHKGEIVILENVPAQVCVQCGEVLLRPDVLERVQNRYGHSNHPNRAQL